MLREISDLNRINMAGYSDTTGYHRPDLRVSGIGNLVGSDWVRVAHELEIADSDISIIKSEHPDNNGMFFNCSCCRSQMLPFSCTGPCSKDPLHGMLGELAYGVPSMI